MLLQMTPTWSVLNGGAGTSTWTFETPALEDVEQSDVNAVAAAVKQFYLTLAGRMPTDLTVSFARELVAYDEDGTIRGFWVPAAVPAAVTGSYGGTYTGGAGAKLYLHTNEIYNKRRSRGGIFVVPLAGDQYTSDGILNNDTTTAIVNAAVALQASVNGSGLDLGVWSRKYSNFAPLSGISCSSRVAFLGTRKR